MEKFIIEYTENELSVDEVDKILHAELKDEFLIHNLWIGKELGINTAILWGESWTTNLMNMVLTPGSKKKDHICNHLKINGVVCNSLSLFEISDCDAESDYEAYGVAQ